MRNRPGAEPLDTEAGDFEAGDFEGLWEPPAPPDSPEAPKRWPLLIAAIVIVAVIIASGVWWLLDSTVSQSDYDDLAAELDATQEQLSEADAALVDEEAALAEVEAALSTAEEQLVSELAASAQLSEDLEELDASLTSAASTRVDLELGISKYEDALVDFWAMALQQPPDPLSEPDASCVAQSMVDAEGPNLMVAIAALAPAFTSGEAQPDLEFAELGVIFLRAADECNVALPFGSDPRPPTELVGYTRPVDVTGDKLPILQVDSVEADPARGSRAPVVSGEDFEGRTVRIDGVASGPTMVVFLAHWCSHCDDEILVINRLRDQGSFPEGLSIVGVSTAVMADRPNFPPDRWLESKGWTYPVIADDVDFEREAFVAAEAFGVSAFPFVVLIDADGVVQARWAGGRDGDVIIELIDQNLTFG